MTHTECVVASTKHLASAVGNPGVHVVSSPATILFIEMACHRAIDPYLEPGEATVGVKFELAHRGAARPGQPMDVTVELVQRDERNHLKFRAQAVQNGKIIMDGEHQRAIVELDRLLRRSDSWQAPTWTLWFDFQSAWHCLVVARAQELAANCGAQLRYSPVILEGAPADHGPQRAAWMRQDLQDHIEQSGLPIDPDPPKLSNTSVPLLACLQAQKEGAAAAFVTAMGQARWLEKRDIGDPSTIASIAEQCELDSAKFTQSHLQELTVALQDNTATALSAGVFEAPTMQFGSRLYCDYPRLDMLFHHTLAAESGTA
jgi:2-hydroxychromene-2-carboxylate isomerase